MSWEVGCRGAGNGGARAGTASGAGAAPRSAGRGRCGPGARTRGRGTRLPPSSLHPPSSSSSLLPPSRPLPPPARGVAGAGRRRAGLHGGRSPRSAARAERRRGAQSGPRAPLSARRPGTGPGPPAARTARREGRRLRGSCRPCRPAARPDAPAAGRPRAPRPLRGAAGAAPPGARGARGAGRGGRPGPRHQVRAGGRRRGGQDQPGGELHHQRLPHRVRAHRLRQLLRRGVRGRAAGETPALRHGGTGRVRPAAAPVLHPRGRLPAVLQRGQPHLLPERDGEVGARDPAPLPPGARAAGGHAVGPAGGRQGAHRAGQGQGEAGARGGGPAVRRAGQGGRLHRVLGPHPEEPQGGLRCGHRGWHPALGRPAAAAAPQEAQKQDSGQNADSVQVLVEEVLLLRMTPAPPGREDLGGEAMGGAGTPGAAPLPAWGAAVHAPKGARLPLCPAPASDVHSVHSSSRV